MVPVLSQDLPVFLGHNPLIVPQMTPSMDVVHEDYLQWHNMAGVPQVSRQAAREVPCRACDDAPCVR